MDKPDEPDQQRPLPQRRPGPSPHDSQPWAPFRTRADFEFCRMTVSKALDRETIEVLLEGFNGRWAHETDITIKNYKDYQKSLAAARKFGVQVSVHQLPPSRHSDSETNNRSLKKQKSRITSRAKTIPSPFNTATRGDAY